MIPGQAIMIIYPDMKSNFIKDICHGSFLHISLCGYDKVDTSVKPEKLHYTMPMLYFLSLYFMHLSHGIWWYECRATSALVKRYEAMASTYPRFLQTEDWAALAWHVSCYQHRIIFLFKQTKMYTCKEDYLKLSTRDDFYNFKLWIWNSDHVEVITHFSFCGK